jgi:hypothetical protein
MLTVDRLLAFSGYEDPFGMRSALPHTCTDDDDIAYDDDGHDTPLQETLQIALDEMFTEEDSIADCCSVTPAVDAPTTVLPRGERQPTERHVQQLEHLANAGGGRGTGPPRGSLGW